MVYARKIKGEIRRIYLISPLILYFHIPSLGGAWGGLF